MMHDDWDGGNSIQRSLRNDNESHQRFESNKLIILKVKKINIRIYSVEKKMKLKKVKSLKMKRGRVKMVWYNTLHDKAVARCYAYLVN